MIASPISDSLWCRLWNENQLDRIALFLGIRIPQDCNQTLRESLEKPSRLLGEDFWGLQPAFRDRGSSLLARLVFDQPKWREDPVPVRRWGPSRAHRERVLHDVIRDNWDLILTEQSPDIGQKFTQKLWNSTSRKHRLALLILP